MILPIVTEPNPILRKKAENLNAADFSDKKIQKLISDLAETMRAKEGAGIAAPQVGESIQICLINKDFNALNPGHDLVLANPSWQKASLFKTLDEEGCLSVPEIFGQVKRCKKIKVQAFDESGRPLKFTASDFFARVIQHEVDHLNGILFIDKAKNLHKVAKTTL